MITQSETKRLLHYAFFIGYAMLPLAVALRNVFHVNIPVILFLALVAGLACIGDETKIIALCIAMMPLSKAFQYKYALLLCIVIYIVKFKMWRKDFKIRVNAGVYAIVGMLLWELLHAFDVDFSFIEYLRCFTELIFIAVLIMFVNIDKLKFDTIVTLLAITTVSMALIVLLVQMQTTNLTLQTIFANGNFRLGMANESVENYGLNYNSNQLGAICNASIVAILVKMNREKTHWYDLLLIATLFVFGFLTLSRTFIVTFAFIFFFFVFVQKEKFFKKLQKILFVALGLLIVYMMVNILFPSIVKSLIKRFMVDDITNGRAFLLSFYTEHIFSSFKNLFFGIGIQNVVAKVQSMYGAFMTVPHNAYQELVVIWGIVGLALFLILVLYMILKWYNTHEKRAIDILPLTVILFATMAGQLITGSTRLIELAFAYICLSSRQNYNQTYEVSKK